jgi:hypothetical protein
MKLSLLGYALGVASSLVVSIPAFSADSFNLLNRSVERQSREASNELLRSASAIFDGLAAIEVQSYGQAQRSFGQARELLSKGANALYSLAESEPARERLSISNLNEADRRTLASWYGARTGRDGGVDSLGELSIGDVLKAAANQAQQIAGLIGNLYGNVHESDPVKAGTIIREIATFHLIGTIAAKAFRS